MLKRLNGQTCLRQATGLHSLMHMLRIYRCVKGHSSNLLLRSHKVGGLTRDNLLQIKAAEAGIF